MPALIVTQCETANVLRVLRLAFDAVHGNDWDWCFGRIPTYSSGATTATVVAGAGRGSSTSPIMYKDTVAKAT